MPGSLKRIRDEMDVKPTPRDKGLTLTLRVTAYDNGMIAWTACRSTKRRPTIPGTAGWAQQRPCS